MDKDFLEKHQNDPAWAEVIRLYSGLFDTQDEREDFILDLADKDVLLAAECKTSSVEEEITIVSNIEKKISINNLSINESTKSMLALLEIQKTDILKSFIIEHKHKRSILPSILTSALSFDSEKFIALYSVLVSINHRISTKEKKSIREFFRDMIFKNINTQKYYNFLINSASSPNITELKKVANELSLEPALNDNLVQTIKKLIEENKPLSIKQALILISQNNLDKEFDIKSIISKLLQFNTSFSEKHAKTFISKYNLENYFSKSNISNTDVEVSKLLNEASHKSLKQAIKLIAQNSNEKTINSIRNFLNLNSFFLEFAKKQIIHYKLLHKFPEFEKTETTKDDIDTVIGTITNIIASRIFVEIENETRPTSIYIGELSNKRIENIFDFEYNGEKLYIGQKLIAKVIGIDEQGRINLSLKQMKNG